MKAELFVAARAAPTTEVDLVRKALHSFPYIRDVMRPASADMLLRLLSEVVIGESIRRLTTKVAVDLITDHARTILQTSPARG